MVFESHNMDLVCCKGTDKIVLIQHVLLYPVLLPTKF